MSYVNHYFNYTQMLSSIKEELPESIDFVPWGCCASLCDQIRQKYNNIVASGRTSFISLYDLNDELIDVLCSVSDELKDKRKNDPDFFIVDKNYAQVMNYLSSIIKKMPHASEINESFFKNIEKNIKRYKSPVSYMARLVISRMGILNEDLLGDFADNWNEDASDEEKSRIIALLIMRQFILQFGDGTIKLPIKDGKGGFTYSDKVTYIRLSDKGKKDKNGNRIATADDYWCPAITEMCKANYGGDFEKMAKNLTFDEFDSLKADRGCRLAALASQLAAVNFGVQKKDRANMYVFAIAFELTFNNPAHTDTDINKCLFYDLNNSAFYKLDEDQTKDIAEFGINFKNFVDIAYLYYLNKDIDETGAEMTPALRLYRTLNTIAYVKKQQKNANMNDTAIEIRNASGKIVRKVMLSEDYKELVLNDMLKSDENTFRNKLIANIECSVCDPFVECPYFPLSKGFSVDDAEAVLSKIGESVIKKVEYEKNGKKVTKQFIVFTYEQRKKLCSAMCPYANNEDDTEEFRELETCAIYNSRGWTGAHLYASDQRTANIFYDFFRKNSIELQRMQFRDKCKPDTDKEGNDILGEPFRQKRNKYYAFGDIPSDSKEKCGPDFENFKESINKIMDLLTVLLYRPESGEKNKKVISRTILLGAYCRHIAGFFRAAQKDRVMRTKYVEYLKSFSAFYDFFCSQFVVNVDFPGRDEIISGANSVLIKSNFSPVSFSCLFDIVAIYVTYHTCLYEIYGNYIMK